MQEYVPRDWRDSLATKATAWAIVGLVGLGTAKLWQYTDRKFCEQYEWLKDQPVAVQMQHANDAFNRSLVREGYRTISVRGFLKDLRKCE